MAASGQSVRNHLLEGELPTRPGEHRYWNVSYSPVYNANDKVEAIAAVILEMTNQKKAEQPSSKARSSPQSAASPPPSPTRLTIRSRPSPTFSTLSSLSNELPETSDATPDRAD